MSKKLSEQQIISKLEFYCAYQERCQFDVQNKLAQLKIYGEKAQEIIAHLITHNFLDEERYAEAFVSGKFRIKKWGRIKIKQHLKQKRISDYSINKGLEQISDEDYIKALKALIDKKSIDYKGEKNPKQKLINYLSQKGYEYDVILNNIKGE